MNMEIIQNKLKQETTEDGMAGLQSESQKLKRKG